MPASNRRDVRSYNTPGVVNGNLARDLRTRELEEQLEEARAQVKAARKVYSNAEEEVLGSLVEVVNREAQTVIEEACIDTEVDLL